MIYPLCRCLAVCGLWICLASVALAQTGRKRALLVGISDYARPKLRAENQWHGLNTRHDLALLKAVLKDKGFEEKDITVLNENRLTTRAGILSALQTYLIDPTQPGDIVYFHFAGHGAQVLDNNGDNDETDDGLDETLVPSDYVSCQDSSRNIRDDEIYGLLLKLAQKKPASVTISLDSCHSGTATREGILRARGGTCGDRPAPVARAHGAEQSASGLLESERALPPNFVVLAAAAPGEKAVEDVSQYNDRQIGGVFTAGLVHALRQAGPSTTYLKLTQDIREIVSIRQKSQHTQAEGDVDQKLFAGTALPPKREYPVKPAGRGRRVNIGAGRLHGMTVGSKFALYPVGVAPAPDKPALAQGTLARTDLTESLLLLDKPLSDEQLAEARAFETQRNYTDSGLRVACGDLRGVSGGAQLLSLLQKDDTDLLENAVAEGHIWDVLVRRPLAGEAEKGWRGVVVQRRDGSLLARVDEGPRLPDNRHLSEIS